ncbi:MAG TPA: ROK family protein [Acidobacteriota bacterium]|nr:ROK family protein [Acidobacteriota bacterium]
MPERERLIGLDLGGTAIKAGVVDSGVVQKSGRVRLKAGGSAEEIIDQIFDLLDSLDAASAQAIGVGAPSVVNTELGIVYDTQNIPSWRDVDIPLGTLLSEKYRIPAFINNDANCFVLGEKYFGKAKDCSNVVGVTIGTGLGAGLIINNRLYSGANCGAGEFGMCPFRDRVIEYYASGQFFINVYGVTGEALAERAARGDQQAISIFDEFGRNVGEAVKAILYAIDPELIIFGGSVSRSFSLFEAGMRETLETFAYPRSLQKLRMEVSELPESAILGAASLCLEYGETEVQSKK